MKDADLDGESFIEMDLLDINSLTPKVKVRKTLRLAWTEVTGMVGIKLNLLLLRCNKKKIVWQMVDLSQRAGATIRFF